ncbi:hypothetical protein EUGRSUZ_C03351 [Eucalyptus grandis]|uniref:Uncharacterized protein n=2 Tax=Eucalyptus grandis TaxID=71139 RepID=A0A059CV02_EUCGR|nr:hypothetical protein EUGRSUZ_C03351 [Eucalyptus grandis]
MGTLALCTWQTERDHAKKFKNLAGWLYVFLTAAFNGVGTVFIHEQDRKFQFEFSSLHPQFSYTKCACTRSGEDSAEIIRNELIYQVLPLSLLYGCVFLFLYLIERSSFEQSTKVASWAFYTRNNRAKRNSDTETEQNRAE